MLYVLLAAAVLAPGAITARLLRHRGPGVALLAGAAATMAMPLVLISGMDAFPPLGSAVGAAGSLAAPSDYDAGRIWRR
ncbi:hypothetical protein [Streptomyces sp. Ru62]|uniref:hypothetical protein n=1 Tax=Streptomyces sp. Ru62 TaxID=2080745 RepID=UPI0015E38E96|nr:hypothetical protein [Streptomyces sp. Ru62]